MPLDIGEWRRDTAHLNAAEKMAYLALRMSYWEHGHLPKDPQRLANIAQTSIDTLSNTQVALSIEFFEDESGFLHIPAEREKRLRWALKHQKAQEKARKAINARWSKYRAKLQTSGISSSDTPSISKSIPDEELGELSVIHKSKSKNLPPPTPSAARRGMNTPSTPPDAPSTPDKPGKSEGKAKPAKSPPAGVPRSLNGAEGHHGTSNGRTVPPASSTGHPRKPVKAENGDARRLGFEEEVLAFWRDLNPEYSKYTLTDPDRRALLELLRRHQGLTVAEFRRLLHNRAVSEINPAAAPHKWLRSILDYSAGPLGKFGKPLREARAL